MEIMHVLSANTSSQQDSDISKGYVLYGSIHDTLRKIKTIEEQNNVCKDIEIGLCVIIKKMTKRNLG